MPRSSWPYDAPHGKDRPGGRPFGERPGARPHPRAYRRAAPPRRNRAGRLLDRDGGRRRVRPRPVRRYLAGPRQPVRQRRRRHHGRAHRPRATDSVPRDLRRLPVRAAGIRARRLRPARGRERGGRARGRRAPDRAARVLADGPRGGGHDRAGHPRREDIRSRAPDRALSLRLRAELGLPGATVPGRAAVQRLRRRRAGSGSPNFRGTRSSSRRYFSPSCTATAASRTRSSSPWPRRQRSTPPPRPRRPLWPYFRRRDP